MSGKQVVATEKAAPAIGAYSQANIANGFVFTSGQLPIYPDGTMETGDAAAQARQSLANVAAILEAAGTGLDRVVKCTVFLASIEDFAAVNEVYASVFGEPYPARSAFAVGALPKNALVEIEAVAAL